MDIKYVELMTELLMKVSDLIISLFVLNDTANFLMLVWLIAKNI